jgi:hypothetical protein
MIPFLGEKFSQAQPVSSVYPVLKPMGDITMVLILQCFSKINPFYRRIHRFWEMETSHGVEMEMEMDICPRGYFRIGTGVISYKFIINEQQR